MSIPVPGRLAEALRQSTVEIRSGRGRREGNGSGVIISPDRILSNAHVVQSPELRVESWEGRSVSASVVKINALRDLALLAVPGLHGVAVTLGDSDRLRPGSPVIAVGNPLGFTGALSSGTVHRVGRVRLHGAFPADSDWICSDLRLAPGNSGGPLANFEGHVIGLNTMIAAGGLAFAIPSRIIQQFLVRPASGLLGVTVRPVQLRSGQSALLLLELTPNGAAQTASLLPGDILIAANGRRLEQPEHLLTAIEEASAGLLEVGFYRTHQDQLRHVTARLQQSPLSNAA
jgi:serine protease Do